MDKQDIEKTVLPCMRTRAYGEVVTWFFIQFVISPVAGFFFGYALALWGDKEKRARARGKTDE